MKVDLLFNHYLNLCSVKTNMNEKALRLKNLEESKAFKTQIPTRWLAMWLNDFEFDVIWTAFELFLKLNSHISELWRIF